MAYAQKTGQTLKTSNLDCSNLDGVVNAPDGIVAAGAYNSAGGADTISASELLAGYHYDGAAGGAVALTLPNVADLQAALLARGIASEAGMSLPLCTVNVTDANNLTVTAGTGGTVVGTAAVNNTAAAVQVVFTAANTYNAFVLALA